MGPVLCAMRLMIQDASHREIDKMPRSAQGDNVDGVTTSKWSL